jgi:hypothetical protein
MSDVAVPVFPAPSRDSTEVAGPCVARVGP